jgi:hypothetical protein
MANSIADLPRGYFDAIALDASEVDRLERKENAARARARVQRKKKHG